MTMPPLPQVPEAVRGRRVLMLRALYVGDALDGARLLAPLVEAAGEPFLNGLGPLSVGDALTMMGPPPPPMVGETHLELFDELPDAVLDVVVGAEGAAMELRHWGGAMARPGRGSGPVGHRDVPFSVVATVLSQEPDGYPAVKAVAQEIAGRLRRTRPAARS